jgi:hypothetical protein
MIKNLRTKKELQEQRKAKEAQMKQVLPASNKNETQFNGNKNIYIENGRRMLIQGVNYSKIPKPFHIVSEISP